MKRHFLLIFIIALTPWTFAADKDKTATAKPEAAVAEQTAPEATQPASESLHIQPRAMGAKWISKVVFFEDGKPESGGLSKEEVVKTKVIDGITCYQIKSTYDWRSFTQRITGTPLDDEDITYFWEYFDEKGSHDYSTYDTMDASIEPKSLNDFILSLPYPAEKGQEYTFDDVQWKVVDTGITIKTPAGTFDNVNVYQATETIDDYSSRSRFFQQPGVGLVQWEWDEMDENGKYVLFNRDSLSSYDLKEPKQAPRVIKPRAEQEGSEKTSAEEK